MKLYEKIRAMREINHWSQEKMAEKLAMSANGYAKIERGQTKLNLDKLQQIANIFNIDVLELMTSDDKKLICLISENSDNSSNYYDSNEMLTAENEKLKLIIQHDKEIITRLTSEIETLKEMVSLLKQK
ncbi:helix-turn-helix domain-containing protein [Actinobacillus pleuropneumoniae]|nr:helix-turn-helix transcriptional regulator [Actinobacillus pleuropneumoniae]EFL80902.1 hypothetical protein APP6_1833 [Actinobacillus pleuropneumoniae serovar 6 str. Femo]UKH13203.1 helix-turn-helix transcriptional regulator [Actinobacillus pleuropneumoniae serovar 6 str. Femo]UKH16207.1 XRE family transcriptional regulator [Actinobacillus pleuropneumoniae]SUU62360.1 Predicted transcriptional regulator [Actinobacillus pleuropneumoniae]